MLDLFGEGVIFMMYSFTCKLGHEPITMTVDATNDDDAIGQLMTMCKTHLSEKHTDMAPMTDEQMKQMIMQGWTKV